MTQKRVAVIRGGMSDEYEVSMKTGASVLRAFDSLNYPKKDIVITRKGEWLDGGKVREPEKCLTGIDVVFLALHGGYGEDGQIQKFLTHHSIPYTGSRALASATAFNKQLTKKLLKDTSITTPVYYVFTDEDEVVLPADLGEKVVVKPVASGSSLDTHVAVDIKVADVIVRSLLETYEQVMVEQYIEGREVTVGVIEGFREKDYYMLPVVEIVPPQACAFYSYDAKYGGESQLECPGRVSKKEQALLEEAALTVHTHLDLKHYSRSDFIIKDGVPYFLEVNTLPGLTEHSLFPRALQAVGVRYEELIAHLISQALT